MVGRFFANVLSRAPIEASGPAVAAALHERFGDAGVAAGVLMPTIPDKRGFLLLVGDVKVLVAFEPVALGLDDLKPMHGALRDEVGPLLDHRAHVLVAALDPCEAPEEKLRASLAVLRVASVVSEAPGASAVLWAPAETLTPAGRFRALMAQADADENLPLAILVRITPFPGGAAGARPSFGVSGIGFSAYFGRDIEFLPQARTLAEMVHSFASVATWLLRKGLVFADGDTCGGSATEIIRVRYAEAGQVVRGPVLLFDIESLDAHAAMMN